VRRWSLSSIVRPIDRRGFGDGSDRDFQMKISYLNQTISLPGINSLLSSCFPCRLVDISSWMSSDGWLCFWIGR
jgi:hypothetical protein